VAIKLNGIFKVDFFELEQDLGSSRLVKAVCLLKLVSTSFLLFLKKLLPPFFTPLINSFTMNNMMKRIIIRAPKSHFHVLKLSEKNGV